MITIRDELGVLGKSLDNVAESSERYVDGVGFLLALLVNAGLGGFF